GWRVSPLDGSLEAQALPPDEAASAAEQADLEGPLVDWKQKGHKVELVKTDALPGGDAYDLKVTMKSGSVRHVWVDAATGQVVRMESTRRFRGHNVTLETVYADYQMTGGVSFPRSIETTASGRPQRLKIVVDEVETNPRLDQARFKM